MMESKAEVKQVIILRKDLNMRKGKMAAQASHASMAAILNNGELYKEDNKNSGKMILNLDEDAFAWLSGRFKKICVSVNSEYELLDLYKKAKELNLNCSLITDSGLTEFNGIPTHTAVAIGPNLPEKIDPLTGKLPLL